MPNFQPSQVEKATITVVRAIAAMGAAAMVRPTQAITATITTSEAAVQMLRPTMSMILAERVSSFTVLD